MLCIAGCHGHHGQLPAGEYLVATSAHTAGSSGQPEFLSWHAFLQLCLEFGLPLNDTWILSGGATAAAARELLDHLALSGCPTADALQQLTALVQEPHSAAGGAAGGGGSSGGIDPVAAAAAAARKGVHLPGSYPHQQWQGSRIEGFVLSQGQAVAGQQGWQELLLLGQAMAGQVVQLGQCAGNQELQRPYQYLLEQAGGLVCDRFRAAALPVVFTILVFMPSKAVLFRAGYAGWVFAEVLDLAGVLPLG
jgi:hypothetical protein